MNIPVKYCRNHVFPWRNVLLQGMNKYPKVINSNFIDDPIQHGELELFYNILDRYTKGTKFIKPEFIEVLNKEKRRKFIHLAEI